jgi:hypothetical protein
MLVQDSGAISGGEKTEWQVFFARKQRLLDEWEKLGGCGGANVLRRAALVAARLGELERRAAERWWRLMRTATGVRAIVVWKGGQSA